MRLDAQTENLTQRNNINKHNKHKAMDLGR